MPLQVILEIIACLLSLNLMSSEVIGDCFAVTKNDRRAAMLAQKAVRFYWSGAYHGGIA
jgi:hypothetical protein